MKSLDKVFKSVLRQDISIVEPLTGGISNIGYKVVTSDDSIYAVRKSRFISDRSIEYLYMNEYLAKIKPSRYTIYYQDSEYLITSYIPQPKYLAPIASSVSSSLSIIHNLDSLKFTPKFDVIKMLDSYKSHYLQFEAYLPNYINYYDKVRNQCSMICQSIDSDIVPSHNDFMRVNILLEGSDSDLVVIDWEFASRNYREFDYASYILESYNYSNIIDYSAMVGKYSNLISTSPESSRLDISSIIKCMLLQDLLWSMWIIPRMAVAKYESNIIEYDSNLKYFNMRYDRAIYNLEKLNNINSENYNIL